MVPIVLEDLVDGHFLILEVVPHVRDSISDLKYLFRRKDNLREQFFELIFCE